MSSRGMFRFVVWLSALLTLAAACTSESSEPSPSPSPTQTPSPTMRDGTYKLVAELTPEGVDPPPGGKVAKAVGSMRGRSNLGTNWQATWTITFEGLTGVVESAEVSYPRGEAVSVLFLCGPCEDGAQLTTTFPSRARAEEFLSQAVAGEAVIVLKTARNPGGEIGGSVDARRI